MSGRASSRRSRPRYRIASFAHKMGALEESSDCSRIRIKVVAVDKAAKELVLYVRC
jgi:hypothetical protein